MAVKILCEKEYKFYIGNLSLYRIMLFDKLLLKQFLVRTKGQDFPLTVEGVTCKYYYGKLNYNILDACRI
jgi:hypothetical protein